MNSTTKTRKPTEAEQVILHKMQELLASHLDESVVLAQESGVKPYVFLDLWLNVITDVVVGMMIDMVQAIEGSAEDKKAVTMDRLKTFLEGSMIIADKKMKKAWGEK